jgi:hypothetical protein
MEDTAKSRRRRKIKDYIDATSKSPTAGVIYALVFGPFGCAYANPWSTVVALFLAVAVGLIFWPLIALVWIGCVVVAPFQVRAYNHKVRRGARYHVT